MQRSITRSGIARKCIACSSSIGRSWIHFRGPIGASSSSGSRSWPWTRTCAALAAQEHAGLIVRHAVARQEIPRLALSLGVESVFANHDYEPQAIERDAIVRGALADEGIALHTYKDTCRVRARRNPDARMARPMACSRPTAMPGSRRSTLSYLKPFPVQKHALALAQRPEPYRHPVPLLEAFGFEPTNLTELRLPTGAAGGQQLFNEFLARMDHYHETRDFPAGSRDPATSASTCGLAPSRFANWPQPRIAACGCGQRGAPASGWVN
jgi:deoxyribodipyrimidine photolyase